MRVYDLGSCVRVAVSRNEVDAFRQRWPCNTLRSRGYSFTFEKKSGDLVDHDAPDGHDGDALVALSVDAWDFYRRWERGK